jgi:hypothetical protein
MSVIVRLQDGSAYKVDATAWTEPGEHSLFVTFGKAGNQVAQVAVLLVESIGFEDSLELVPEE